MVPEEHVQGPDIQALIASLERGEILRNVLLTVLLWASALLLRALVSRALTARGVSGDARRRFMQLTRNAVLAALALGTAALWFDELKVFALSLVAVAAAVVLATKELIMCLGGTLIRTSSRAFDVGDRIEIQGMRGDVVDSTLLTTTLLEVGPGRVGHQRTGRAVVVPNSLFLGHPVVNESFTDDYVLHNFQVSVKRDANWGRAERALLDAATAEVSPYAAEARAWFERVARERGIDVATAEPRVLVEATQPDSLTLHCRFPAPAKTKGRIEQAIVRRLLDALLVAPESGGLSASSPPSAETAPRPSP
jgi:small-conductance mechanosensitive channel